MIGESLKIKGVIDKIHFSKENFIIVKIINSNHESYGEFSFKGYTNSKIKVGDQILITHGCFNQTKYGTQIEKGSLITINTDSAQSLSDYVSSESMKQNTSHKGKQIILTSEQESCIAEASIGNDIKIKAYAGTGKTATLVEISKRLPGRGLYLAYNKAIQQEAALKFPPHVVCKTAHSLAYGYLYNEIDGRVQNLSPGKLLKYIDIKSLNGYSSYELAYMVIKLIRDFSNSASNKIDMSFINTKFVELLNCSDKKKSEIISYLLERSIEYCELALAFDSKVPIEHDFYLKMFQLSQPNLSNRFSFILFDECQDANPVLLEIVSQQKIQKISVGDEYQQIYGWRGAINSFQQLYGKVFYLSNSFRFGNEIADIASIILRLKGEKSLLSGLKSLSSKQVDVKPKVYTQLSRTNVNIINKIIENIRKKIHVVGGISEILDLAKSGFALYVGDNKNNKNSKTRVFQTWQKLLEFNEKFDDPDLSFLANILDTHGNSFGKILSKIEKANYVEEKEATVIFSTIHKSKGREWKNISISDDFIILLKEQNIHTLLTEYSEEFNLLYVAITRTREKLYLEPELSKFLYRLKCYCEAIEKD